MLQKLLIMIRVEAWKDNGSKSASERATATWQKMLANYEAPPLDEAKDKALKDFIAKRKGEMKDSWIS